MHKKDKKMTKKVLYKHINSAFLQAAEDRREKGKVIRELRSGGKFS